jgi:hypothetical protein
VRNRPWPRRSAVHWASTIWEAGTFDAEGSNLAGAHEVRQGAEGLVDIGARIGHAHLVQVDPVGLQPAQRALDRFGDPPPRRSAVVGVIVAERNAELDGEHHALPSPAGQRLAQDLF